MKANVKGHSTQLVGTMLGEGHSPRHIRGGSEATACSEATDATEGLTESDSRNVGVQQEGHWQPEMARQQMRRHHPRQESAVDRS
jgi:hypothetical protein